MKKLVTITLALCLALGAGNVYGQQAEKQEKEKAQKEVKMQKAEGEKQMEKAQEGEKQMEKAQEGEKEMNREMNKEAVKAGENADPQGNAYGRNKGGLERKEFGQARASDAKAAHRAKAKREKMHRRVMVKKGR